MTLMESGAMMDDYFSCKLIGCCVNGRKVGDHEKSLCLLSGQVGER